MLVIVKYRSIVSNWVGKHVSFDIEFLRLLSCTCFSLSFKVTVLKLKMPVPAKVFFFLIRTRLPPLVPLLDLQIFWCPDWACENPIAGYPGPKDLDS